MTKSDLIDVLCETQKLPKGRAELLVHVIFDSMEAALERGERIEIRGFGSFEIRSYRAYEGRNPRTGVRGQRPPEAPALLQGRQGAEGAGQRRQQAKRETRREARDAGQSAAPVAAPVTTTGPLTDSGATATAAAEPAPAGTPTRATA